MEKRIYFLSPLEAEWYERGNNTDNPDEVLGGAGLLEFQEEIQKKIEEIKRITGADLMEYYDGDDSVKAKVKSLEPVVTVYGGELKGCAVVRVKEPLNQKEMEDLKKYLTGQYSDGWGEGFEQDPITAGDGVAYVHFWNRKDFQIEVMQENDLPEKGRQDDFSDDRSRLKMQIDLKGPAGNIFFVEGMAVRALCEAGRSAEADEMDRRIRQSGNYYRALDIINEYVQIEPDYRKQFLEKSERKNSERER